MPSTTDSIFSLLFGVPQKYRYLQDVDAIHGKHPWLNHVRTLIPQAAQIDAAHDKLHSGRVFVLAIQILQKESIQDPDFDCDIDVLLAAIILHDLDGTPKDSPDRSEASTLAAQAAVQLLEKHNELRPETPFPAEKFADLAHAIEAHSFSAQIKPTSTAAQILQDADNLDALGIAGFARLCYTAGKMDTPSFHHPTDPFGKTRELDDKTYMLDHFLIKLATLKNGMHFPTSSQLAEARTTALEKYLKELVSMEP